MGFYHPHLLTSNLALWLLAVIEYTAGSFSVTNATSKHDQVYVTDGSRYCVNAKSFLGLVATRDFSELWCESEKDIYRAIYPWVACEVCEDTHEW